MYYKRIEVCPRCKGSGRLITRETEEEHLDRIISQMTAPQLTHLIELLTVRQGVPTEQLPLEGKEDE